MKQNEAFINV